jgi:hypothetical protein
LAARPRIEHLRHRPAAGLSWIDVAAIATARRIREEWELRPERHVVHVHSVAEAIVGEVVEAGNQDTADRYAQGDVYGVVKQTPPVRIAGGIASDQT